MVSCGFDDGFRAGGSDEGAVGEDSLGGEDDFGGAGDEGEDVGVWDEDDADARLDEGFLEGVHVHLLNTIVVASDNSVAFGVRIGVAFSVNDGELPFCSCFKQEALDGETCSVCKDCFGGVDVIEGVVGDLVVGLVEFVDDLGDAVKYFGAEVDT